MDRNDEELVKTYLDGEEQSLRDLLARYLHVIYNFVYQYAPNSADAEDITQEVFVKVWKNLRQYNPELSFRAWLFGIAKNAAIDWLRKKNKTVPFSHFDTEDGDNILAGTLTDLAPLPDELAERKGTSDRVAATLEKLPSDARAVLRFRYHEHSTFREIAVALAKPLNTVKSQHRRALAQLKKLLTGS